MINRITSPIGRLYSTPPGIVPGVTTVLSDTAPASKRASIDRWRQMTPDHEAITANAAKRGTMLHEALEEILKAKDLRWDSESWENNIKHIKDETTINLVKSLQGAGILSDIEEVLFIEEGLWYYCDGIGYAGTMDICYRTKRGLVIAADWKSKEPKPYCPTKYADENKLQLVAYAGALSARHSIKVDGLAVNYCFTDGSPAVQALASADELSALWLSWKARLKAWWSIIGEQNANLLSAKLSGNSN